MQRVEIVDMIVGISMKIVNERQKPDFGKDIRLR